MAPEALSWSFKLCKSLLKNKCNNKKIKKPRAKLHVAAMPAPWLSHISQRTYWIYRTSKIYTSRFCQVRERTFCGKNCYPLSVSCPVQEDWAWIQSHVYNCAESISIDNWVKSLSCLLSRHIWEEMCFIIPRNCTAMSWGVDLNEIQFLA